MTKKRKGASSSNKSGGDARVIDAINAMKDSGLQDIQSDVEGSYRGTAKGKKRPVQDQDDL